MDHTGLANTYVAHFVATHGLAHNHVAQTSELHGLAHGQAHAHMNQITKYPSHGLDTCPCPWPV